MCVKSWKAGSIIFIFYYHSILFSIILSILIITIVIDRCWQCLVAEGLVEFTELSLELV